MTSSDAETDSKPIIIIIIIIIEGRRNVHKSLFAVALHFLVSILESTLTDPRLSWSSPGAFNGDRVCHRETP